ncbi:hypothetical protein TrLO_g1885 [Triparma laevis f. longispina]|uniref:Polycomb protein VEFS-Box domain-containing protein n=1 Tax=Triparma laevis f. longispina TaxID=1714387 RepID=A0A9W7FJB3_9STRA|nr:hypothetical protein TrLO_g1885 [Triparma laevis f. longispina]
MSGSSFSSATGNSQSLSVEAESFRSLFLAPSLMAMSKQADPRTPIFLLRNLKLPKSPKPLPPDTNPTPIFHLLHPPYVTTFPSSTCPFCPLPLPSPIKFTHHLSLHSCTCTSYLHSKTLHYVITREREGGVKPVESNGKVKRWYSSQSSLLPLAGEDMENREDSDDESDPAKFQLKTAEAKINDFIDVTPSEKAHMVSRNSAFDVPHLISDRNFVDKWLEELKKGEGEEGEVIKECLNLWDNGLIPGRGLNLGMDTWRTGKKRKDAREGKREREKEKETATTEKKKGGKKNTSKKRRRQLIVV